MPRKPSDEDTTIRIDVSKCLRCSTTVETKRLERHLQVCTVDPLVHQREEQERASKRAEQRRDREFAARIASRDAGRAKVEQERLAREREQHAREREQHAQARQQERAHEKAVEQTQRDAEIAAERWRVHILQPNSDLALVVFEQIRSINGELEIRIWARPDRTASWRLAPSANLHRWLRDNHEPIEVSGPEHNRLESTLDVVSTWTVEELANRLKRWRRTP
jgi:hypothetical protein